MGLGDFLGGAAEAVGGAVGDAAGAVGGTLEQAAFKTVRGFQRAGDNFSSARKDISEGNIGGAAVNAVQGVVGAGLSGSGMQARGSILSAEGSGIAGPAADASGWMGDKAESLARSAGVNDPVSTRAINFLGGGAGQWFGNSVEKNAVSLGDLAANSDQVANLATDAAEYAVRDPRAAAGAVGSAATAAGGWVAAHPRESAKYAFRELTDPVGLALTAATGGGSAAATAAARVASPMSRVAAREAGEAVVGAAAREATEATMRAAGREVFEATARDASESAASAAARETAERAGTSLGQEAARRTSGLGRIVDEIAYPSGNTMLDKAAQYTSQGGIRNRLFRGSPTESGPIRGRWEEFLTNKVASQAEDSTVKGVARDIAANALNASGTKTFSASAQNVRRLNTAQKVYRAGKAVNAAEDQYVQYKDDPNAYLEKGVESATGRAGEFVGEHPEVANRVSAVLENTVGDADISNTRLALGAVGLGAAGLAAGVGAAGLSSVAGSVFGSKGGGGSDSDGSVGFGTSRVSGGGEGQRTTDRVGYSTSSYSSGRGFQKTGGSSSLQSVGSGQDVRDPYAGGGLTQKVGGGVRDPYRQKKEQKAVGYEVRDPYKPLKQPVRS